MEQSFGIYHYLIFVIPGFITVWSFRYFTDSKKSSDFEYFALSLFWGLLIFVYWSLISRGNGFIKLIQDPYGAAFILSIFSFIIGLLGAVISRSDWFIKIIDWLKTRKFNLLDIRKKK